MQHAFRPPRLGDLIRRHYRRFVLACVLIALTLPLMIIVSIAIKCDSRGPVIVRAKRLTHTGRAITILRFRTTEAWGGKLSVHAPLTRVGSLLRHTRVDRLPQLLNVLRGEMTCFDNDPEHPFFLE